MFRQAEVKARQPLGDLELIGTIDRIDGVSSTGEPTVLVIDYKTESDSVTRQRIQSGAEDRSCRSTPPCCTTTRCAPPTSTWASAARRNCTNRTKWCTCAMC